MSDANVEELIAQLRARRCAGAPAPDRGAACLSFGRARALTLNPERWEAAEREHVAGCRRCARLLRTCAGEMPHLSLWTLIRRRLGRLSEEEARSVEYHLETGECRRCRARDDRLTKAMASVVQHRVPFPLPAPAVVGAATCALELGARSLNNELEVELFEQAERVTLEVRTKQETLRHALVAYLLRGRRREQAKEGFLVLRPDLEGWASASADFNVGELYWALNGRCEEVVVTPVCIHVLTSDQREPLLSSAARARQDPTAWAAWRAWVARAAEQCDSVDEEAWQMLCDVRSLLATG